MLDEGSEPRGETFESRLADPTSTRTAHLRAGSLNPPRLISSSSFAQSTCPNLPTRYQFVDVSAWREPYSPCRILVAWVLNLGLLVLLLLTVVGYYLTRADEIEFEQFALTFTMITLLQPFGSQVKLRGKAWVDTSVFGYQQYHTPPSTHHLTNSHQIAYRVSQVHSAPPHRSLHSTCKVV